MARRPILPKNEPMRNRFLIALVGSLCAQATVTASTSYSFGTNNNTSFGSESYQEGVWSETNFNSTTFPENITCVVGLSTTQYTCGDHGPTGAYTIDIPAAPGNAEILPNGVNNYVMIDGDPAWGAPVWTEMTGLTIGNTYLVSFYQASSEEDGNNKEYDDNWLVYVTPGATGSYLCPQSYCSGITSQVGTIGAAAYSSPVIDNTGGKSTDWEQESFTFQATAANEVLEFVTQAIATSGGGFEPPLLDLADVTVVDPPSTPEPGTAFLAVSGIGLVAVASMLRRRKAARQRIGR